MPRLYKINFFTLTASIILFVTAHAQTINVVPNPGVPDLFIWNGGALSGYAHDPVLFNNSLVLQYNASGVSDVSEAVIQLAVYKNGDSLHLIPNPDGGIGCVFNSQAVVYNSKLYVNYKDASGVSRLAVFNGTSLTLIANPDASTTGYAGSPIVYNNMLYFAYELSSGVTQLAQYNGTGITLIPNPDASPYGYVGNPIIFNNKLYINYVNNINYADQIGVYDGTSLTLLPNPDGTPYGYQNLPIIYKNKLYVQYYSSNNQYQLLAYDGVNNPYLITNPETGNTGFVGFPIVFDDTLFFQYYTTAGSNQLAKFDGTSISIIPNPDASTYGFWNTPVVYNNNLYIFYLAVDGKHHLTQYNASSNNLTVFSNPDGGYGYWDQPIVYGSNLYFQYYNASGNFQLGYFDGTSLKLIPNPAGIYNGVVGENGYTGQPILWNNLLYMQFASVPYGDAGNLAYFDQASLPIKLLSFTAEQQGNSSFLQWVTAGEINNKYFDVERSADGKLFNSIGAVPGHGTTALTERYQFADNNPVQGINYYRLKQVDYDGNYAYSAVAAVNFSGITGSFGAYPNPAGKTLNLTLPNASMGSVITVYDMNGIKVMQDEAGANAVLHTLDVSKLSAGVYQLILMQGTQKRTIKFVKQ